jgi:hypothetical protein
MGAWATHFLPVGLMPTLMRSAAASKGLPTVRVEKWISSTENPMQPTLMESLPTVRTRISPAYIGKGPKLRPGNGDPKDEMLSEKTEDQEQLSRKIQHITEDIRREEPAEAKGKQL